MVPYGSKAHTETAAANPQQQQQLLEGTEVFKLLLQTLIKALEQKNIMMLGGPMQL